MTGCAFHPIAGLPSTDDASDGSGDAAYLLLGAAGTTGTAPSFSDDASVGVTTAPQASLDASKAYYSAQSVVLTATTDGASVHYTTDGSDPSCASPEYATPIAVPANSVVQLNYMSCSDGLTDSSVVRATYVAAPALLGTYDSDSDALGVHASGDYAYLADWGNTEFDVVDVSDPASMTRVGGANIVGNPRNAFVDNGYAYIPYSGQGFRIFDLANPASPALVSTVNPGNAFDARVSGNTFYAATNVGLFVYDTTNKSSPALVGQDTSVTQVRALDVSGSYAYLARSTNGLSVVDVSSTTPVPVATHPVTAEDVSVSGNIAYVAGGTSGLIVVDVSNPAAPFTAGVYATSMDARGVHVNGTLVYVADALNGLMIFDVSDPASPALLASYATSDANGIHFANGYAYFADGSAGLHVFRVEP